MQDQENGSYLSSRKTIKNHSQDQEGQHLFPGSIRPAQIRTVATGDGGGFREGFEEGGGASGYMVGGENRGSHGGGPWNLRREFGGHKEEEEVARGVVRLRRVASSIKGRKVAAW